MRKFTLPRRGKHAKQQEGRSIWQRLLAAVICAVILTSTLPVGQPAFAVEGEETSQTETASEDVAAKPEDGQMAKDDAAFGVMPADSEESEGDDVDPDFGADMVTELTLDEEQTLTVGTESLTEEKLTSSDPFYVWTFSPEFEHQYVLSCSSENVELKVVDNYTGDEVKGDTAPDSGVMPISNDGETKAETNRAAYQLEGGWEHYSVEAYYTGDQTSEEITVLMELGEHRYVQGADGKAVCACGKENPYQDGTVTEPTEDEPAVDPDFGVDTYMAWTREENTLHFQEKVDAEGNNTGLEVTLTPEGSTKHEPESRGNVLYRYTGETVNARLSISNRGSSTEGNVFRVYFAFDPAKDADGKPKGENGMLGIAEGEVTFQDNGHTYTMKVKKMGDSGLWYYEIPYPNPGDTLILDIPMLFPSPTSGGGMATVWGELLTKEQAEQDNATPPDVPTEDELCCKVVWETKADEFPVTKKQRGEVTVVPVPGGSAYLQNLGYNITVNRSGSTLDVGKDHMTSIDFTDTMTLPKGTQWAEAILNAVKNKNYMVTPTTENGQLVYAFRTGEGTDPFLFVQTQMEISEEQITKPELELDAGNLVISWAAKSADTTKEIDAQQWIVKVGDHAILMDSPNTDDNYDVVNKIEADEHFMYSGEKKQENTCTVDVNPKPGYLEMKKTSTGGSYMGEDITFTLNVSNPGVTGASLTHIWDPLPSDYYMSAKNIAEQFAADDDNELAGITIFGAKLATDKTLPQQVTDVDGSKTEVPAYNNSDNSNSSYNGRVNAQETETCKIEIKWNDSKNGLIFLKDGVQVAETTGVSEELIQQALDSMGYVVTNNITSDTTKNTWYQVDWNYPDDHTLSGGASVEKTIYATVKDTFMLLGGDCETIYWRLAGATNTAYAQGTTEESKVSASNAQSAKKDFQIGKSASFNGETLSQDSGLKQGSAVKYNVRVQHWGSGSYSALPVVDHMSGTQVLMVPADQNPQLAEELGVREVTNSSDNNAKYYALIGPGTYKNIWLADGQMADTVTVTGTGSTRDTLIKWYFTDYSGNRDNTLSYWAYVCPDDLDAASHQVTINNECWLNDRAGHRLYAKVSYGGVTFNIDKEIVKEVGNTGAGETYSQIKEGESVVYRLMLRTDAEEVTLHGSAMWDILPQASGAFEWDKTNVHIDYGDAEVTNPDNWKIVSAGSGYQKIEWQDDFAITFGTELTYIYVTLDFPQGDVWNNYSSIYGSTTLTNTYHVWQAEASVTHDLLVPARGRLQKGVAASLTYTGKPGAITNGPLNGRLYYSNPVGSWTDTSEVTGEEYDVIYYISLYNSGSTRLYVTKIYDLPPKGFTYWSTGSELRSPYKPTIYADDGSVVPDNQIVEVSAGRSNGQGQMVGGRQLNEITLGQNSKLSYDQGRGLYYLKPGQACYVVFRCRVGQAAETEDLATNLVTMPYYDYNGAGVILDDQGRSTGPESNTYLLNDGNASLEESDPTGAITLPDAFNGMQPTQWFTSEVSVNRGGVTPGISKKLTKATNPVTGAAQTNPAYARPDDLLTWTVTAENDGMLPITDYLVSDVMQSPYQFTDDLTYETFTAAGKSLRKLALTLTPGNDNTVTVTEGDNTSTLTIGGNAVDVDGGKATLAISNTDTGSLRLDLRLKTSDWTLPNNGDGKLVLSTLNKGVQQNRQYANMAYITPLAQVWSGSVNKGNKTTLTVDGTAYSSVQSSAYVIAAVGEVTTSIKRVTETDNPANTVNSNSDKNYIVLPKDSSTFRYDLTVNNSTTKALTKLVMIDTLPEVGDHSVFDGNDPRFSEFKVSLADDPQFSVMVNDQKLDEGRYSLEFSSHTNFTDADWNGGETRWSTSYDQSTRAIRLVIQDASVIPSNAKITLSFTAKVDGRAVPGSTAWNSFGYHCQMQGENYELEASPLKVGVKVPGAPTLTKQLVDNTGRAVAAAKDMTFGFLIYRTNDITDPSSLLTREQWLDALGDHPYQLCEVTVKKGESSSDTVILEETENFKWEQGESYSVVELPNEHDFSFDNWNGWNTNRIYTLTYDRDDENNIVCRNWDEMWTIALTKIDASDADLHLPGAVFGLYSPIEADRLTEVPAEYADLAIPTEQEFRGVTWYLTSVRTTNADGQITWGKLKQSAYYLLEVKAPDGYHLPKVSGQVLRRSDDEDQDGIYEVQVANKGGFRLPETGGHGTAPYTAGGLLLIAGAGTALLCEEIKKRKGSVK